jgi:hypothetical protein
MNVVQSSLSSPRTSRIIFWLGAALVVAAVVVFIVKKSNDGGSSSAAPAAKGTGSILSSDQFQKEMGKREPDIHTNKKWATVPASAKLAVRRFVVDGAGERNLARAWQYMHPDLRGGLTFRQFVHGGQLPFVPFEQMNLKIPMSITLTQWSGHDLLAEVGIASTDKVGRGAQVFSIGATKAGKGAHARWLVNYWGSQYTPPVRADPSQNFGG